MGITKTSDSPYQMLEAKIIFMKTSNAILFVFLFLFSCQSNSVKAQLLIGKIENSSIIFTADKATLLKNYNNNLLKQSRINGNFTQITIISDAGSYYLVFNGTQFKSSLILTSKSSTDNSTTLLLAEGHVSCTTSDCASEPQGCVPSSHGLSCTPCANKGICTKTVSLTSLLEE